MNQTIRMKREKIGGGEGGKLGRAHMY